MFNNIGSKVKGLAVFFCVFGMIGSLAGAIVLWTNDLIAAGFGTLIGGCLFAWVGSWVSYCVGDTNVKVTGMQEELAKLRIQPVREEQKRPAPQRQDADRRAADAPEAKPEQPSDGQTEASPEKRIVCAIPAGEGKVECPVCGSVQNAGRSVCWDCGAKFRDDEA